MSSCKKCESKGSTGQKAVQAGAKSTAETARNAASLSELTRLTLTPAGSDRVLQSDKRHRTCENAQTVTGTESERDESENSVVFGCTLYASPRPFVSEISERTSQQILSEDDARFSETDEWRKRQLAELQRKRADLVNRQHKFAMSNKIRCKT